MKTRIFVLMLLSFHCLSSIPAQRDKSKLKIEGIVLDLDKNPVTNAIVIIDGEKTNSLTNSKGEFKIRVDKNSQKIGIVSFGCGLIEEPIDGRTRVDFIYSNISFQPGNFEIPHGEESIDVGYNNVKRKDLTNAVGIFEFRNSKKTYKDIYEMLDEIPGIRLKVFNMYGPVGPSYVVNGVMVSSISDVLPSTVESIVFLKDASAAIYGSRAFGGVILIKTKIPED